MCAAVVVNLSCEHGTAHHWQMRRTHGWGSGRRIRGIWEARWRWEASSVLLTEDSTRPLSGQVTRSQGWTFHVSMARRIHDRCDPTAWVGKRKEVPGNLRSTVKTGSIIRTSPISLVRYPVRWRGVGSLHIRSHLHAHDSIRKKTVSRHRTWASALLLSLLRDLSKWMDFIKFLSFIINDLS